MSLTLEATSVVTKNVVKWTTTLATLVTSAYWPYSLVVILDIHDGKMTTYGDDP